MTFPNSSLYSANLLAAWGATATNIDLDAVGTLRICLYDDTMDQVPSTNGTPLGYSTTGELTTADGYTRGTKVLGGTTTWAVSGAGILTFSTSTTTVWTGLTKSNIYGTVIYDSGATSPVANACIVAVKFGTVGSCGGGDFTIDWADGAVANTIFTIDPTP